MPVDFDIGIAVRMLSLTGLKLISVVYEGATGAIDLLATGFGTVDKQFERVIRAGIFKAFFDWAYDSVETVIIVNVTLIALYEAFENWVRRITGQKRPVGRPRKDSL